jgi:transposase-like protein
MSPDRAALNEVAPPKVCPVCRSTDLTTTAKQATATSYWRCLRCGEVWNQERLRGGDRRVPRRW